MNFPRFWAQARSGSLTSWRWSNSSMEEAESLARVAVDKLAVQFQAQDRALDRYGYPDRPLREPVLREIRGAAGELCGAVTRNSYGCQVLNTSGAMFVDVDMEDEPTAPAGLGSLLGSLFGGGKAPKSGDAVSRLMAKAEAWARSRPDWNWRVYRTRGGFRLMATHKQFDPKSADCQAVFEALGADPLYRKLCETQQTFRARLTPKPWRCGVRNPPTRWPFLEAASERAFSEWERKYQAACRGHATCELLNTNGSGRVDENIQPLIALHDEMTGAKSGLNLA